MHAVNSREGGFSAADLLHDTVRTLQMYYIPMRSHALQIYHSAFVTMPKCSLQHSSRGYTELALHTDFTKGLALGAIHSNSRGPRIGGLVCCILA
jgi:hypothetical protein